MGRTVVQDTEHEVVVYDTNEEALGAFLWADGLGLRAVLLGATVEVWKPLQGH